MSDSTSVDPDQSEAAPATHYGDETPLPATGCDADRAPGPEDDVPDVVPPSQSDLVDAIRSLGEETRAFHVRAENQEQIIRQMQSRIEQLQGDQVQALLKPVIKRLASLHAQAAEAEERARAGGEAAYKDFDFFKVSIEEAFGLIDIESVGATIGSVFEPRRHHALRMVATGDRGLEGCIQRVIRQGFTYIGAPRVFLPAQVSVYRFEAPQPSVDDVLDGVATQPTEGDLHE